MNFKVGDLVQALCIIPVSNKQMMFEGEDGNIIDITPRDDGHYLLTVKRSQDGAIFKANEYCWQNAEHC